MIKYGKLGSLCGLTMVFLLPFLSLGQTSREMVGTVEKVTDGYQFVEGPVWKDGVGLLFSDINGNTIYRWSSDSGATVHLRPSGNSNGLTLDRQGRLLLAQQGNRRVARVETNGNQTSLASLYNGKKLNSPNDLVVKSDGSIWFTDPPYGINANQEELGFSGIYRISPGGGLQLLDNTLRRPNGIVFSPDEMKLYVNDSEARVIYVWDVVSDSTLANKRQFAFMGPAGYADGMKVDTYGNLYSAGPLGVWVFSPAGTVLDTIVVPGQTMNCNWGESDRKTLYITSGTAVYRIRPNITSINGPRRGELRIREFELHPNYPNPFNPTTRIGYGLPQRCTVQLTVFNPLGQQVAQLVNGVVDAGYHEVTFDASRLASGVYFYGIRAGEFIASRKLLLVR